MKNKIIPLIVLVIIVGSVMYFSEPKAEMRGQEQTAISSGVELYFAERMVTIAIDNSWRPIEGFDARLLIQAFSGLVFADFEGVETLEGGLSVIDGALVFSRTKENPITSAEKTIARAGYDTLLMNIVGRLDVEMLDNADVDELLELVK